MEEKEYFGKRVFDKVSLSFVLFDSEEVSPVEEVEDSEDSGEENAGEDVDLLGSESEVVEPQRYSVGWDSEERVY